MVTASRLRVVFLVDCAYSAVAGLLLLSATWDGLMRAVDLPQRGPALLVQLGGAVLVGVAYLLWLAARTPSLMLPVARASAIMNALSAGVVIAWLVYGRFRVGPQGKIELFAAAALMSLFAVVYTVAGLRRGGYGPEPPPAP